MSLALGVAMLRFIPALLLLPSLACSLEYSEFNPVAVTGIEPAAQIAAGANHTCALLNNGNLACWGDNETLQLGTSVIDDDGAEAAFTSVPTHVPMPADPLEVRAGGTQSCARLADGTIMCWGNNAKGELGFPDQCEDGFSCDDLPNSVFGINDAIAIEVGGGEVRRGESQAVLPTGFACAIREDQSVACWGANDRGQAGKATLGNVVTEARPVLDDNDFPIRDISDLALGDTHACALEKSGTVRCWGANTMLQRGQARPDGRVAGVEEAVALGAGTEHSCAVLRSGQVSCWGNNVAGQSGAAGGNDVCQGEDPYADCRKAPQPIQGVTNAVQVVGGERHSCARTEAGEVYCWGGNQFGQLGVDKRSLSLPSQRVPLTKAAVKVVAGAAHTCALHGDGTISCWGKNNSGQVGVNRER